MHGHVLLQKSPLYIQLVSNQIPHLHSVKKKKGLKTFQATAGHCRERWLAFESHSQVVE